LELLGGLGRFRAVLDGFGRFWTVLHRLYIPFTSTLFKISLKQNWRETLAAASFSRQIGYL